MSNIKLGNLARKVLLETIEKSGLCSDQGLRLKEGEGGLTLSVDYPNESDSVIKNNGRVVIIISREVEEKIGGATIDVKDVNGEFKLMIIKN